MKIGQHLSSEELQTWAAKLVSDSGEAKSKLAIKLGVSPGALTRATSEKGPKWFQLQARIVELLTNFTVVSRTELVVAPRNAQPVTVGRCRRGDDRLHEPP